MTRNRGLRLVVLVGTLVAVGRCAPASRVIVERFEVAIQIAPDGVADVTERIIVRLDGEAPGSFQRLVAPTRVEGLEFVDASIGGAPVASEFLTVDAGTPRVLRVTWRLAGSASDVHDVGLRYRATGILGVLGRRGQFEWPAIPAGRAYPIRAARVDVAVLEGVLRLGEWGLAEAGWQVTALPNGVVAARDDVPPDEGATVLAEVAVDPARMAEPRWQHDAEFARQLVPAFIAGGLFILTIGGGVIWIIRFEASSRRIHPPSASPRSDRDRRRTAGRERSRTAEGLYVAGVVCLVFGLMMAGVTYQAVGRYGVWSMAIPGSILIVGLLFVLVGRRPSRAGPAKG